LLLFEAERAWSYSQELSAQALLPANSDNARTLRHSATGRFRRAVHWATQLLSHCQALHAASRLSTSSLLEATVYTLILNGRFLRSRDAFDDALAQLSVARHILDSLTTSARTSRDQALFTLFADEVGPEIRYCAHELGNTRAYDVDAIVGGIAEAQRNEIVDGFDALLAKLKEETSTAAGAQEEGRKTLGTLLWEDEPVPIRNPELVDVLLRVQQAQAKLSSEQAKGKGATPTPTGKRGVAAYDAILAALSDAEEVARKLAEAQKVRTSAHRLVKTILILFIL
jgi:signal recognition particle subunit SRP68